MDVNTFTEHIRTTSTQMPDIQSERREAQRREAQRREAQRGEAQQGGALVGNIQPCRLFDDIIDVNQLNRGINNLLRD